ncbi:Pectinesterase [Quillaja saponaria]|uniref:Pectinesterase n=1 Tax=Quillaja saponaria TaxID=32244 RepID=A0AAD7Q174_QUISA|nr:Pectinesterase [Quillaja saponaria]
MIFIQILQTVSSLVPKPKMASKQILSNIINLSFFFLLSLFSSLSVAERYAFTTPIPPETICKFTPHPSYCKNILPKQPGRVYDYGQFSFKKSLIQSQKFLNLVKVYCQRRATLSQTTIAALEDCKFLAEQNIDYLSTSMQTVTKTNGTSLSSWEADDVQTYLSAIITNQETCLDGLRNTASDSTIKNALWLPLSNDTKLHSTSLALFTRGWVHEKKNKTIWDFTGKHVGFKNGRLPLKMSNRSRAIYESARRWRKPVSDNEDDEESVFVRDTVVVSQDGSGNFTTINDAIAAAPNNTAADDNGYFLIYIREGVYEEYVNIAKNKRNLMMIGDGINQTIITGNHSVDDGFTTFNSATFAVTAPGFVAVNITFRNTAGPAKHQAVAMRSGADNSTFYSCSFEGYQDTLYTHSLRQFYTECDIYGTIDFIFGNAAVVLQNCNIYPRLPLHGQFNPITAQGRTDPNQNTGTSIHNCVVKAADDLAPFIGSVKTYLGRPWKEYSRTIVMQSFLDSLIDPVGWHEWSGDFALNTLYYAEFANTGPGSNTTNRVTWPGYHVINATDAANFTVSNFLQGDTWLPQTGVPYVRGLTKRESH